MIKYSHKNGSFLKDGHTMFEQDVLKDLERLAYLENKESKEKEDGLLWKFTGKDYSRGLTSGDTGRFRNWTNDYGIEIYFQRINQVVKFPREDIGQTIKKL